MTDLLTEAQMAEIRGRDRDAHDESVYVYWSRLNFEDAAEKSFEDRRALLRHIDALERERKAVVETLLSAVTASEFGGIECDDVMSNGKLTNWFDARDVFLNDLRGAK